MRGVRSRIEIPMFEEVGAHEALDGSISGVPRKGRNGRTQLQNLKTCSEQHRSLAS